MALSVLTPPAAEPVTLDEAKAWLRVTIDAEDALISALITAARERVEAELGLGLIATAFRETFDALQAGPIRLARAPLIAVQAVAAAGPSGFTALPTGAYAPKPGERAVWPVRSWPDAALRVDYTAGYGAAADDVPGPLKQALLTLVAHAFDHRGEGEAAPLTLVEPWLAPYRPVRL